MNLAEDLSGAVRVVLTHLVTERALPLGDHDLGRSCCCLPRIESALPENPERGPAGARLLGAANVFGDWIKNYGVVISPLFKSPPPPPGYLRGEVPFDTLRQRLREQVGYTLIHNVSGAPAMSLPIGIQFSAASGPEKRLLEVAYGIEAAAPWVARRPAVWVG